MYFQRNASNPTDLYMLGMNGTAGKKVFKGPAIKPIPNSNETAMGPRFSIWALGTVLSNDTILNDFHLHPGGLAALPDNKTAVGVFPALNESKGDPGLYSTMVTVQAVDPMTIAAGEYPPIERIAPQLFYVSAAWSSNHHTLPTLTPGYSRAKSTTGLLVSTSTTAICIFLAPITQASSWLESTRP
jgi:hypothetical protein